jgi:hypothetical protein
MKNIVLAFIATLSFISLAAQINVKHVTDGTNLSDKQGIFYALPTSLVKVDVIVLKTEYIAGPYAEYAAKYLDLKDVNTSDYNEYVIIDLKLSTLAVPDPEQVYFAEITDKVAKEGKTVLLSLSTSGMAMDLEGNMPAQALKDFSALSVQSGTGHDDLFKYFAETNLYEQFDTIIQKVVVDTVMVEKKYLERNWVEKSDEDKALEAANKISRIREARFNLITGYQEIPYEADALAYMDRQLVRMEKEYMSLFTGVTFQKHLTYSITVNPAREDAGASIPVFVFSERSGVKEASASGGDKVMLSVEPLGDFGTIRVISGERNKSGNNQGFYYRIPVMARLKLSISNDLSAEGVFPISQLGTVSFLPPNVTSVQFHPETGAVKTLLLD